MQKILNTVLKFRFELVLGLIALFGLVFRCESYFLNREFWHDEVYLAANFIENTGFLWTFKHLNYFQAAPPLFLLLTKILTLPFGISEYVLRLIPFLASVASIFAFLILTKQILKTKSAIIFANAIFAINFPLIRYASEFKQYETDVLIYILLTIFISKLNFEKLSTKGCILLGLLFSALFLFSQPSCFILFGIIIFNLIEKRPKSLIAGILPILTILIYKFSMPQNLNNFMYEWWELSFLSPKSAPIILKENINFFLLGQKYLKFLCPLCFAGFFVFVWRAFKYSKNVEKIVVYTVFCIILASILRQYPITGRLVLFLTPFLILFCASVIDFKTKSEKLNSLILGLILAFSLITPILYGTKTICKNRTEILDTCRAKTALSQIKEEFQKEDSLIVSYYTKPFYVYYSTILNFKPEKFYEIDENDYEKNAKTASNKGVYWFYIPVEFEVGKKIPSLEKALQRELKKVNKNYEKRTIDEKSFIIKVSG